MTLEQAQKLLEDWDNLGTLETVDYLKEHGFNGVNKLLEAQSLITEDRVRKECEDSIYTLIHCSKCKEKKSMSNGTVYCKNCNPIP